MREVLLGALPQGVTLTRRAVTTVDGIREVRSGTVSDGSFVIARDEREDWRWWTWAGAKANRTLGAWIPDLVVPRQMSRADCVRLHRDLSVQDIRDGLAAARAHDAPRPLPAVDKGALRGLKFSAALPENLARRTMSARLVNSIGAQISLEMPVRLTL